MMGQACLALGVGATNIALQERTSLHLARLGEKAFDSGAEMVRQAALLAGQDLFWIVTWIGVAGAVLLTMQRRFD